MTTQSCDSRFAVDNITPMTHLSRRDLLKSTTALTLATAGSTLFSLRATADDDRHIAELESELSEIRQK